MSEEVFLTEELQPADIENITTNMLIAAYVICFACHTLVNKYVLSELKFTFPTIFQGWQMLSGAILLQILAFFGKISNPINLAKVERGVLLRWIPSMMCHVVAIYSGSRALSTLPVPTFLSLHNVVIVIAILHTSMLEKNFKVSQLVCGFINFATAYQLYSTDSYSEAGGYVWMAIHIYCTVMYMFLERNYPYKSYLRRIDRLHCNYIFSCLILGPMAYYFGHISEAATFEKLFFIHFYIGCLASGIFGALAAVSIVNVMESPYHEYMEKYHILSKVIAAIISIALYEVEMNLGYFILVILSHSTLLYVDSSREASGTESNPSGSRRPRDRSISDQL